MVIGPLKFNYFGFLTFTTNKPVDNDYLLFVFYRLNIRISYVNCQGLICKTEKYFPDLSLFRPLTNFIRGEL